VSEPARIRVNSETPVEQARRLEGEARQIARGAADVLLLDLNLIAGRCADIGTLASLPPGLRDLLPRLGDQITQAIEQVRAIDARSA
jgi:hypothetical protein